MKTGSTFLRLLPRRMIFSLAFEETPFYFSLEKLLLFKYYLKSNQMHLTCEGGTVSAQLPSIKEKWLAKGLLL